LSDNVQGNGVVLEAIRENKADFKPDYPSRQVIGRMRQYSNQTTSSLQFLVEGKGTKS
jgi:hypothetical protein